MVGLTFDFVCLLASYSLLVWSGPTTRDQFNFTEQTKYLVIGVFSSWGRLIDSLCHTLPVALPSRSLLLVQR